MCDPVGAIKDAGSWVGDHAVDIAGVGLNFTIGAPALAYKAYTEMTSTAAPDLPKPPKPPGLPPDPTDADIMRAAEAQRRRTLMGQGGGSTMAPIPAARPPSATGY